MLVRIANREDFFVKAFFGRQLVFQILKHLNMFLKGNVLCKTAILKKTENWFSRPIIA